MRARDCTGHAQAHARKGQKVQAHETLGQAADIRTQRSDEGKCILDYEAGTEMEVTMR